MFGFSLDYREKKLLSKIDKRIEFGVIELHFHEGFIKYIARRETFPNQEWKDQVEETKPKHI